MRNRAKQPAKLKRGSIKVRSQLVGSPAIELIGATDFQHGDNKDLLRRGHLRIKLKARLLDSSDDINGQLYEY